MTLPKENEHFPGFYNIPGYCEYAISSNGNVLNVKFKRLLKGSYNPDGYYNYRLTNKDGVTHTWGRHRLLAYVFKHPGCCVSDLVVNHKNGIKGDDWLDNLEWVTYQENIEHAGENGLTKKCRPILVRNVTTGEVVRYPSVVEAARDLKMSKDAITHRLKSDATRIFPEKLQYKYLDDLTEWFNPENLDYELLKNGRVKKIVARSVISGNVKIFDSIDSFCKTYRFSPASVSQWLNNKKQLVLPGFIQVKTLLDKTPWREISDPYLELERTTGKKVICVKNPESGEKHMFLSAVSCAKELKLLPTTLNHRLKSNGSKVFSDGYTYAYYCADKQ